MIFVLLANATVHRAAANDIDFRIRAARGSVWNGLLCVFVSIRIQTGIESAFAID